MNGLFTPVHKKSELRAAVMRYVATLPPEAWLPYYNFSATPIPHEILDLDPLFAALAQKRKFHVGVLRTEPNTCYNWHVDTDRKVALNMLLCDDGQSRCVFAPDQFGVVTPIVELRYEPDTYYVFNTTVLHAVFNFSEPRYLLSVEFLAEDRGLPYDELCADIKGLNYGSR